MALRIAITLGDPRGIGPEVVEKTLRDPPAGADFVVIGPDELVGDYAVPVIGIRSNRRAANDAEAAGSITGLSVERAVNMALKGEVQSIVTGPAEKRALHAAGYRYPGHTEWSNDRATQVRGLIFTQGVLHRSGT